MPNTFALQLQNSDLNDVASSTTAMVMIDNYQADGTAWTKEQVAQMSANKVLGGYVSIGEAEVYRDYWQASWSTSPPSWLGPEDPEWQGNRYVDFRDPAWVAIAKNEVAKMIAQGFEAVYADVIDVYYTPWFLNRVGGNLSVAEAAAKDYVKTLADYAHSLNPAFKFYVNGGEDLVADKTYLAKIDGVFKEQVYYGINSDQNQANSASDVSWTTGLLDQVKAAGKDVFVIHYTTTDAATENAATLCESKGYGHYEGPLQLEKIWYTGGAGADVLQAGSGANMLRGLSGDDRLHGASGNDTVSGGAGADVFEYRKGDTGADVVKDFQHGVDKLDLSGFGIASFADLMKLATVSNGSMTLALPGQSVLLKNVTTTNFTDADVILGTGGTTTATTTTSPSAILGTSGSDTMTGNASDNAFSALGGDDLLTGAGGRDTLDGGAGNDRLKGGVGADVLTGGAGQDIFIFTDLAGPDRITDFNPVDDTMKLAASAFTALSVGKLSADAFYVGTAAHDASDRIVYDQGTGALTYDSNGNAAGGATLIATLSPGLALTQADFVVF